MALADHLSWFSSGSSASGLFWWAQDACSDRVLAGFQDRRRAVESSFGLSMS